MSLELRTKLFSLVLCPTILVACSSEVNAQSHGSLIFQDWFTDSVLSTIYWNPYIANNASRGWPWNMRQGQPQPSSAIGGRNDVYLDYDWPSFITTGSSTHLLLKEQEGSTAEGYSWTGSVISSYPTHNNFGSGTVKTPGLTFQNVYVEVRARMPYSGNGGWPAIWFLAAPGYKGPEIDLFEGGFTTGSVNADRIFACNYFGTGNVQQKIDTGANISAAYHAFGMQYRSGHYVKIYFDGKLMCNYTSNPPTGKYYIILNNGMASSGTKGWHSQVNGSTVSPNYMKVQYVKIYNLF